MGCTVRNYEYIRNHMDEYQYTMALVKHEVESSISEDFKNSCPPNIYERGIEIAFYKKLIDSGEMEIPDRCKTCPFHSVMFNPIGQVCDQCDINMKMYIGDMFFAESRKRPEWCPLGGTT